MANIWLINYGETVSSYAGLSLADAERLPLSGPGRAQVAAVAASLVGQHIIAMYHTGSLVAQYTAEMLSRQCIPRL